MCLKEPSQSEIRWFVFISEAKTVVASLAKLHPTSSTNCQFSWYRSIRAVNSWVCTKIGGVEWLVGRVYFYLKSNLSSLINGFDEGSDRVPGDGKRE